MDPYKLPITEEARAILNGKLASPIAESELLGSVEQYLRKYVILPEPAYLPMALWAIGTHVVLQFDAYPYIAVVSAVKRCGKTRLAEVLETITRKPWRGTAPTPAAMYRSLEDAPTVLLDEMEPLKGKNRSEMTAHLLAVLNEGYKQGGFVRRCDGPNQKPRDFPVYGPKLFAAIGELPDTLMDRSIVVHMKRRAKTQKIGRFLMVRIKREAKPLQETIARFAQKHRSLCEAAYEMVADQDLEYLNDRDAELWFPLFAVCAVLESRRLPALEHCARALSGSKAEDDEEDSYALTLLRDIRKVWPEGSEKYETSLLIDKLKALEESPWGEHQLTPRKLARLVRPFEVVPRTIRVGERTSKGYLFSDFVDAFTRYLAENAVTCVTEQ